VHNGAGVRRRHGRRGATPHEGRRGAPALHEKSEAVNAYSPPVVTLDLDVAIAAGDLPRMEKSLAEQFEAPGSDLRLQLQTDPRYEPFVRRARVREMMGLRLPVAAPEDVLQGKIWAVQDAERRPSKRQNDLADIARLLDAQPALRA